MLGGNPSEILSALDGIVYLADPQGKIVAYGGQDWAPFAERNGATDLVSPDRVLGHDLFTFILGDEVRAFYRKRMDEILNGEERAIVLPTRCDAPHRMRELRLAMTPFRKGGRIEGILFHSTLLNEEERPPLSLYDFQAIRAHLTKRRPLPMLSLCSLCQKVRLKGSDHWITGENYYRAGGPSEVQISHGLCDPCADTHYGRALGE